MAVRIMYGCMERSKVLARQIRIESKAFVQLMQWINRIATSAFKDRCECGQHRRGSHRSLSFTLVKSLVRDINDNDNDTSLPSIYDPQNGVVEQ